MIPGGILSPVGTRTHPGIGARAAPRLDTRHTLELRQDMATIRFVSIRSCAFSAALILLIGSADSAAAQIFSMTPDSHPAIAAFGTGEVRVSPGRAVLYATFTGEDADAENALAAAIGSRDRAITALVAAGIPRESVTVTGATLGVSAPGPQRRPGPPDATDSRAALIGLRVLVEPIEELDGALAALAAAGVESVPYVILEPTDIEAAQQEATRLAVAEARVRAADMVAAAGVRLGRLTGLSVMPTFDQYQSETRFFTGSFGRGIGLMPNDLTVRVTVSAAWELDGDG